MKKSAQKKATNPKDRRIKGLLGEIKENAAIVRETALTDGLAKRIQGRLDAMMQKADDPEHSGPIKEILQGKSVTQLVDFLTAYSATTNPSIRLGLLFPWMVPEMSELSEKIEALTSCSDVVSKVVNKVEIFFSPD